MLTRTPSIRSEHASASGDASRLVCESILTRGTRLRVGVFQYNILSQPLARTTYPAEAAAAAFSEDQRLRLTLGILRGAAAQTAPLFALQEVPADWHGKLALAFEELGYRYFSAPGGNNFNGLMGPAIAVPKRFDVVDIRVSRPGALIRFQSRPRGWRGVLARVVAALFRAGGFVFAPLAKIADNLDTSPQEYASKRPNSLVAATLRESTGGPEFVFATYHMPCAFWWPPVLTLQAAAAFAAVGAAAGERPAIFAGDFNFTPRSREYAAIHEKSDAGGDSLTELCDTRRPFASGNRVVDFLASPLARLWLLLGIDEQVRPFKASKPGPSFRSAALSAADAAEPEYTNWSPRSDFKETLDYVFHTGGLAVESFAVLGGEEQIPSALHPSDHLPLFAEFAFPPVADAEGKDGSQN